MTDPTLEDRDRARRAVGAVLFNAMNFPEKVQPHILGQNMGPLNEKLTDAILDAGLRLPGDTEALTGRIVTVAWEDGIEREPFCGLEDCECPDHEGPPKPAGTYITVRLDTDPRIGLWPVTVHAIAPATTGDKTA